MRHLAQEISVFQRGPARDLGEYQRAVCGARARRLHGGHDHRRLYEQGLGAVQPDVAQHCGGGHG